MTDTSDDDLCGATCRDGSPCQNPPVDGATRCRMHGGTSTGAPEGNQRATRHGLYADPSNVLEDLAETDPAAYEWILKKYDSYLDSAPFEDGSAKADQLKQICAQEYVIWQTLGLQLEDGVVVSTNEPDGTAYGDRLKDHPVNLPLDRMQRTVTRRLRELGVLDDPDSQQADAEQSKIDALRSLMEDADDE